MSLIEKLAKRYNCKVSTVSFVLYISYFAISLISSLICFYLSGHLNISFFNIFGYILLAYAVMMAIFGTITQL